MKKLIVLILALSLSFPLFSQDKEPDKNFYFGVFAIPTVSWANTDDADNISGNGVKWGINLGLTGDYMFTKNYGFSFDLLHSSTGVKLKADSILTKDGKLGQNIELDYSIRAFQIPVSLKFKTNEIGYMTYWVQAGIAPSFSYRTRLDVNPPSLYTPEDEGEDRNPNEEENDFVSVNDKYYLEEDNIGVIRIPLMFGLGTEYNLSGNTSLVVAFRYEYGLSNFMKAEKTKAYRHGAGIVLGIKF